MFCTTCGTKAPEGAKFCPTCATPFPSASSAPAPAPQANGGTTSNAPSAWDYYVGVWKKYVVFEGRAGRAEYWYFVLINVLITVGLSIFENAMWPNARWEDNGPLSGVYSLAVLLPSIAVGIRRMHDLDRTGWWVIVPIMNFILPMYDGTPGQNRFGADPKGRTK